MVKRQKNRQYNGQKKKDKKPNNKVQNITQKTNDRAIQTPLKRGVDSGTLKGKQFLIYNRCHA